MANTSVSKAALFVPSRKLLPALPLGDCQTQAAPPFLLSRREPSIQMVSRRLHSLAVVVASALPSTKMLPRKRRLMLHSCTSTVWRASCCS